MDHSAHSIRVRIGGVPYGVGRRLVEGLEVDPRVELTRAVPSQLVTDLRDGRVDAALVSSIETFRRPGYRALAEVGICCRGPVGSVRAFRRPGGAPVRSVGLDTSSETSVALLRILLRGPLAAAPGCTFERIAPTLHPAELPHDLVLLIGDCGLHADPGEREPLDLGALWQAWTGLAFVFALWLIRPGTDAARIATLLHEAWLRQRDLPRRADEAHVHYAIGPDERAGLARFADEAHGAGLLDRPPAPVAWLAAAPSV
ncbi:MAG: hypothetical protein IPM29_20785 [Planctomycetes bacterium]|nr:hypothetical protein [Planctomycetota bacterium]